MCPVVLTIAVVGSVGYPCRTFMDAGLLRVCVTAIACELMLIPLAWFVLLDSEERRFVVAKVRKTR